MSNAKRKVSYKKSWEDEFKWITQSKEEGKAYCSYCKTAFKIDNSGKSQIKHHESTDIHEKNEKRLSGKTSQRVLTTQGASNTIGLSQESTVLSFADQVLNAEILEALDVVESNHSFASTNGDNNKVRRQFPDSKIANSYHQGETKTKYVIQFGIAPYVRKKMIDDFQGQPFTFKFDETTTSQIKKQYDGYVQYWSLTEKLVVNRFDRFLTFFN